MKPNTMKTYGIEVYKSDVTFKISIVFRFGTKKKSFFFGNPRGRK